MTETPKAACVFVRTLSQVLRLSSLLRKHTKVKVFGHAKLKAPEGLL